MLEKKMRQKPVSCVSLRSVHVQSESLEASSTTVDVARSRRTTVWGFYTPRLHTADVHPATVQQAPGLTRTHMCARTHAHTCSLRLDSRCSQEVRVDTLMEETGLSAAMLLHALQLLIDKGGPLTCSRPDDPTQGPSLPPQCRLSLSPSSSSLLPLSVLRGTEAQSAGGS